MSVIQSEEEISIFNYSVTIDGWNSIINPLDVDWTFSFDRPRPFTPLTRVGGEFFAKQERGHVRRRQMNDPKPNFVLHRHGVSIHFLYNCCLRVEAPGDEEKANNKSIAIMCWDRAHWGAKNHSCQLSLASVYFLK